MDKTKILAITAFVAILSACGSDNGSLPELVKSYPNSISPFDTLVVKFKSELIDLDKLDTINNIILNQGKRWIKGKAKGKELRFIGTNTTPGGLNYFEEGANDSIEFKKIKNADNYEIKDRLVFYFSTLRLLDSEPNDSKSYANEIDLEKAKKEDGITFAGVLDHKIGATESGQSIFDMDDYYMLKLKAADTVSITVTNREDLSLIAKGPSGTTDTTFQAVKGKSNVFKYIVGLKYLLEDPTLSASVSVPFYINVTDNATTSPPNPYTIRIKVMEYKK